MPERRLLMIAYQFPPSNAVGRLRTVKFCKYLPRFGWQPVVLTHELPAACDPKLLEEIPLGTEVYRAGQGHSILKLVKAFQAVRITICRAGRRRRDPSSRHSNATMSASRSGGRAAHFYWPDPVASWAVEAFGKATATARTCQALYSSAWPVTCHVLAYRIAKATGLPWIMDNRDPWTVTFKYPTRVQRNAMRRLELRCVDRASFVLNSTEPITAMYREAFSRQPPDKFVTLPNGYDPDDFIGLPEPTPGGPLTLVYLGSLYGGRTAEPLVRSVHRLHQSGCLPSGDILIRLIGANDSACTSLTSTLGIPWAVETCERVSYRRALELLATSDVALIFGSAGDMKMDTYSFPTKAFEYFYLGKTVLGLLQHGALWDRLTQAGCLCVTHEDLAGIDRTLLDLYQCHRSGVELPTTTGLPEQEKYSRLNLAEQLAHLLDVASDSRP